MSTFAWAFVESLHVHRMLTELRNVDVGPMRFYHAVGWGLPAVITGERPGGRGGAGPRPRAGRRPVPGGGPAGGAWTRGLGARPAAPRGLLGLRAGLGVSAEGGAPSLMSRTRGGPGPPGLRKPRLLLAVPSRHPDLELCWAHRNGYNCECGAGRRQSLRFPRSWEAGAPLAERVAAGAGRRDSRLSPLRNRPCPARGSQTPRPPVPATPPRQGTSVFGFESLCGVRRSWPPDGFVCFVQVNTVIFILSAKASCRRQHHYYERKGIV